MSLPIVTLTRSQAAVHATLDDRDFSGDYTPVPRRRRINLERLVESFGGNGGLRTRRGDRLVLRRRAPAAHGATGCVKNGRAAGEALGRAAVDSFHARADAHRSGSELLRTSQARNRRSG